MISEHSEAVVPAFDVGSHTVGWFPDADCSAAYNWALAAPPDVAFLEVGSYCGRSACFIGQAAKQRDTVLFCVDTYRGSPGMQPGEPSHDPAMMGPDGFDSLPYFRRTQIAAGLEDVIVPVAGSSGLIARYWNTPLGFLHVDGDHEHASVAADFDGFRDHVVPGGIVAFHDSWFDEIRTVIDGALGHGYEQVEQVGSSPGIDGSLCILRKL